MTREPEPGVQFRREMSLAGCLPPPPPPSRRRDGIGRHWKKMIASLLTQGLQSPGSDPCLPRRPPVTGLRASEPRDHLVSVQKRLFSTATR